MKNLTRSINHELPYGINFNKYAQQILVSSKATAAAGSATASTPTITSLDSTNSNNFLKILGASLINSIQLQNLHRTDKIIESGVNQMDMDYAPHVVIDSSSHFDAMDDLQKQLEYDKFMNEVWIGIVLTLIIISMIFCICSCFLYHQFRTWKKNYHNTLAQSQTGDLEEIKIYPDHDDPVPEYTLVSGLPTYEAALELLHKTPKSCILVYPSVFNVFNEKSRNNSSNSITTIETEQQIQHQQQQQEQQQQTAEVTTPLLANTTTITTNTPIHNNTIKTFVRLPSYAESQAGCATNAITLITVNEKNKQDTNEKLLSSTATANLTHINVTQEKTTTTINDVNSQIVKSDKC